MELVEQISRKIVSIQSDQEPMVVAVCGAADLGKSYLSAQITQQLNLIGSSASHLTLDSFLMDRSERIKNGLSGYQSAAHDLSSAMKALDSFKNGQDISYFPYDHQSGKNDLKEVYIAPCCILVLDGLHSMHEMLIPYINFSVFVYTEDDLLRSIRLEADIAKRKQSAEFSRSNEVAEFNYYKREVEPYKKQADCLLYLKKKWKYSITI